MAPFFLDVYVPREDSSFGPVVAFRDHRQVSAVFEAA